MIDFKKAFDSIDHNFITTALKAYNFGEGMINRNNFGETVKKNYHQKQVDVYI